MTPLILIAGFLGAGKTTLLRALLPRLGARGLRPHVILNDYENADVDAILEQARVEQDPTVRLELYREAERLIIEDAAWLPLYFSQSHVVVSEDVEGWFEPPMVLPRLRFVKVDR